jgi:hypothetical protein
MKADSMELNRRRECVRRIGDVVQTAKRLFEMKSPEFDAEARQRCAIAVFDASRLQRWFVANTGSSNETLDILLDELRRLHGELA